VVRHRPLEKLLNVRVRAFGHNVLGKRQGIERVHRFRNVGVWAAVLVAVCATPSLSCGEPSAAAAPKASQQASPGREVLPDTLQTNLCTEQLLMSDPKTSPSWTGWGNGPQNLRFQPGAQAKLTPKELPQLELKWAFGYANVSSALSQPIVVGGRLFAPSENGHVYALNARTGCRYWTYKAQAGVLTAMTTGAYRDAAGDTALALFFGDQKANAYAVDAQTGREIWVRKVDTHPLAAITGALAFEGSHVFVSVRGSKEAGSAGHSCCTFRGSVSALDANTGAVLWKTYTVDESSPRAPSQKGTPAFGPAGGGISSTPTVDSKRRLVYVATGNSYADPVQLTTDAVLALDVNTGEVKWSQQLTAAEAPAPDCQPGKDDKTPCPKTPPVDFALSAPPALVSVNDRDLLVLPQQSGMLWALDPEKSGAVVWQYRIGQGGSLGSQWGVAVENDHVYLGVADLETPTPGGMHAVNLADGKLLWDQPAPTKLCGIEPGCSAGQGGPLTAIPGAVLNGGLDGGLRAYSTEDGTILWTFDTNKDFATVNGVKAHGGSMDSAGAIVVDGMVYVSSGSGQVGRQGNVLLALGLPEGKQAAAPKAKSVNCAPFCKD